MTKPKKAWAAAIVLVAILMALGLAGPGQLGGDAAAAKSSYRVKSTDRGSISQSISASGSVRPLITVEIGSQLSGQVDALYADYNDEVPAGALLARIDPQTFETAVKQAEAQLAVANASVSVQQAAITRAEAQLEEARRQRVRQQELFTKGNVAESTLDTAKTNEKAAAADMASAQAQLENAVATVAQRQAALDQARIDLGRTEIRSPIDGTVIERSVDVGQTVAASLSAPTLFQLAQDLSEIQVEADVDEADIGAVLSGNRVTFSVDAYPDRTFGGAVKQIRLAPDEGSNVVTYTVIITAENRDRALLPGMTANVEIFTGEKTDVVRVTNDALRFRPADGTAVAEPARPDGSARARVLEQMADDLNLTDAQREQIRDQMQERVASLRQSAAQGGGGMMMGPPRPGSGDRTADRIQMRQQMEAARDRILKDVLTDDQWQRLLVLKKERANTRRAQVWVMAEDGRLQQRPVVLGLSDDNHTEVIAGLAPGMPVIVGLERTRS